MVFFLGNDYRREPNDFAFSLSASITFFLYSELQSKNLSLKMRIWLTHLKYNMWSQEHRKLQWNILNHMNRSLTLMQYIH